MMKRPVLLAAAAYCTGIVLACFIYQFFVIMMIIPLTVFLFIYARKRNVPRAEIFMLSGIFAVCGYANFALQYTILSEPFVPYFDNNVTVTGYVDGACKTENNRLTFEFYVEDINHSGVHIGRKILVNIYNFSNTGDFSLGRKLILHGILRNPPGSRNPGGFNYRNYLYSGRIPATLSVNGDNAVKTEYIKKLPLKRFGLNLREYILSVLEKNLTGEKAALAAAMLTGYRENLTEVMENAFSASGLTHIMAVSGANLAFLVFPLLWIFSIAGLDRRTGAVLAIPFIFLYILVTGMEASVLRAAVMAVLLLIGRTLYRKAELVNSVAIAVLVLLIINPFMFFDVGFQLSVGATLGLGILYKRVKGIFPGKIPGFISETLAATISAQAGVLPILVMNFNKISVISLFSNLLVVPVTGFATCLGALCVIFDSIHPFFGKLAGYALEAVSHFILFSADKCASVKWAEIRVPDWSFRLIFLYYAFILLMGIYGLNFFRRNKQAVVACVFAVGLVLFVQGIMPGQLKVIFVDVGQGDCILVRTPEGKCFLVDGGGTYNEDETGYYGRQVILPLLMHENIPHIDMAMITHAHSDHMGGIMTLAEIFNVKSVGLPDYPGCGNDFGKLIDVCEERNIPVNFYKEGDVVQLDGKTVLEIYNPPSGDAGTYSNLNNTSICGMLKYGELSILLTGDIEAVAEKNLLKYEDRIDCDILKVAHHGGKESTAPEFLDLARPEAAVISVGRNNYGHPSDEVIQRLHLAGSRIYTTEKNGAVIVISNGNSYRIKTWVKNQRYTFLPQ